MLMKLKRRKKINCNIHTRLFWTSSFFPAKCWVDWIIKLRRHHIFQYLFFLFFNLSLVTSLCFWKYSRLSTFIDLFIFICHHHWCSFNLDRLNIDSDADLNWSWTEFKRRKMLISVKLLTKYVIIIYALGSEHEKFGAWIKAVALQRRNSRPG